MLKSNKPRIPPAADVGEAEPSWPQVYCSMHQASMQNDVSQCECVQIDVPFASARFTHTTFQASNEVERQSASSGHCGSLDWAEFPGSASAELSTSGVVVVLKDHDDEGCERTVSPRMPCQVPPSTWDLLNIKYIPILRCNECPKRMQPTCCELACLYADQVVFSPPKRSTWPKGLSRLDMYGGCEQACQPPTPWTSKKIWPRPSLILSVHDHSSSQDISVMFLEKG